MISVTAGPSVEMMDHIMHPHKYIKARVVGVVCALAGAAVLLFDHGFVLTHGSRAYGNALVLVAVVAIAINTVIIKPQLERLGTLVVMGWYYIVGLAVTAPFFWKYIDHTQFLRLPLQAQAELAYILILGTVLPMYLLYRGTEKLTSVHTALYRYIQPVIAGILALVRGQAVFDAANIVALAFIFAGVVLFFKHWTRGFLSSSSILVGIIAGYLAAIVMGFVLPTTGVTADGVEFTKAWVLNWNKVAEASWFAIPKLVPVKIVFDLRAILPVMIMFIVTAVETVGDISGVMEGGMSREATDKELSGGIICDGLGSTVAACFGVLPNTSFSQNVGLVAMTKVVNRGALATGAIFLMLCGLIPKLGALISIMPQAVLGGAAVMMFSSIVVSGIQLITKEKMTPRTLTIVSVALGVGYGMGANAKILANTPQFVQLICGESGIVPAAFVAILLNCLLPRDEK